MSLEKWVDVIESKANFTFARCAGIDGFQLYSKLKQKGILIRHFSSPKINQFNRITIGTPEQMEAFINAVKEILNDENSAN